MGLTARYYAVLSHEPQLLAQERLPSTTSHAATLGGPKPPQARGFSGESSSSSRRSREERDAEGRIRGGGGKRRRQLLWGKPKRPESEGAASAAGEAEAFAKHDPWAKKRVAEAEKKLDPHLKAQRRREREAAARLARVQSLTGDGPVFNSTSMARGGGSAGGSAPSANLRWIQNWAAGRRVPLLEGAAASAVGAAAAEADSRRGKAAFHTRPVTVNSGYSDIDVDELVAIMKVALKARPAEGAE